jgi:hypothetical protein
MSTHKKKLLGLALSSGGVLGFAHIGVLRALEEMNVEVGLLSGASMGALVAVLNAEVWCPGGITPRAPGGGRSRDWSVAASCSAEEATARHRL